jgi:hypothetical protein
MQNAKPGRFIGKPIGPVVYRISMGYDSNLSGRGRVRVAVSSSDERRGGNKRARSRTAPLPKGHGVYGTRDTRDHHPEQGTRAGVVHARDVHARGLYAHHLHAEHVHADRWMKRMEPLKKRR